MNCKKFFRMPFIFSEFSCSFMRLSVYVSGPIQSIARITISPAGAKLKLYSANGLCAGSIPRYCSIGLVSNFEIASNWNWHYNFNLEAFTLDN